MPKKIYTVLVKVEAEQNEFDRYRASMTALPHIKDFNVIKTEDLSRVKYPSGGVNKMDGIYITFNGKVSKDAVESIVEYWNSVGYVQGAGQVDWESGEAHIEFDPSDSPSHDLGARNILELLLQYLEEGTPFRKTPPYDQALKGLGLNKVQLVQGV